MTPAAGKLAAAFFLLAMTVPAQQAPTPQSPAPSAAMQSNMTFAARTGLVIVPVIVTDKKGHHLTALKQSDFTIEENGHPRQIATFEEVSTVAGTFKASPPSPYPFSNFAFVRQDPRRVTIIVLDLLNTPYFNQTNVREQLIKFLSAHLSNTNPTSLTLLTKDGLRLVHSFTTDPSILLEALKSAQSRFSAADQTASGSLADIHTEGDFDAALAGNLTPTDIANAEGSQLTKLLAQQAGASYVHFRQQEQTAITLSAMQELAQSSSGIPGRKSVIWASGGLPFLLTDPDSFTGIDSRFLSTYEETWRALNDANVAVYTIDAHGLGAPDLRMQSRSPISNDLQFPTRHSRRAPVAPVQNLQDSLKAFADATGGKACYNRNDLDHCMALAEDDSSQYYMLTFYLPGDDRKPGWRKLKVHVATAHGEIRSREQFYVGDDKPSTPQDVEQEFELAFSSPMDYTAVPLGWKFTKNESAENGNRKVTFEVFLPPSALVIEEEWMKFNVHVVATDAKEKPILVFSKEFHGHIKPGAAVDIARQGLVYKGDMTLAPGRYHLKLMVRDDFTGKFGTVQAPYSTN